MSKFATLLYVCVFIIIVIAAYNVLAPIVGGLFSALLRGLG